ncbi:MAG: hypothetical protein QNJ54_19760 [Prochloraceae cyanobacterium]|nr:hypothetical protein [Prochloraceae cyanobacterium]
MNQNLPRQSLLFLTATFTLNFSLISVSNAEELNSKVKNNQQLDQHSQLWGQLSSDFNTCYTAIQDSDNVAHSPQSLDTNIATTKFNKISPQKNPDHTIHICQ